MSELQFVTNSACKSRISFINAFLFTTIVGLYVFDVCLRIFLRYIVAVDDSARISGSPRGSALSSAAGPLIAYYEKTGAEAAVVFGHLFSVLYEMVLTNSVHNQIYWLIAQVNLRLKYREIVRLGAPYSQCPKKKNLKTCFLPTRRL